MFCVTILAIDVHIYVRHEIVELNVSGPTKNVGTIDSAIPLDDLMFLYIMT